MVNLSVRGLVAAPLATLVALPLAVLPAGSAVADEWRIAATGMLPSPSHMRQVSAVSAHDVWLAGTSGSDYRSELRHWDGSDWRKVTAPASTDTLEAVSAKEVWAAGSSSDAGVYRYDGEKWHKASNEGRPKNKITEDFTAAGEHAWEPYLRTVGHFDGARWTESKPLVDGEGNIENVEARTRSDVWALGVEGEDRRTVAVHWDGSDWSRTPKMPDIGEVRDVTAVAADDVWAVGEDDTGNGYPARIAHWDGSAWHEVAKPGVEGHRSSTITVTDDGAVWINGRDDDEEAVAKYDGSRWSVQKFPVPDSADGVNVVDMTAAPGGDTVWAVGESYPAGSPDECPGCRDVTYRNG